MGRGQRLAYLGCSFSIGIFSAFNNFTLSLWLRSFTASYVQISQLGNSKSLEGAVVSPLTGAWSDRVWLGWLGRRRPFILVGGLLSALLLWLTPLFADWPLPGPFAALPDGVERLVLVVVTIFLFTLTFNMMDDIHKALLADLTDGAEQNTLSALSTVVNIGGQVGFLMLGSLIWSNGIPDSAFGLAALLMAAGILLTVFGLREPSPSAWEPERARDGDGAASTLSPGMLFRHYRGAFVFCLVNFCYWSGVNAVLPLLSVYTVDILGATEGQAQWLPALLLLSTAALAVPMGWLGTKLGKRRVIGAGYAIMAVAALAGLLITTTEQGAVLFFLAGVGNSATVVLAIPLLADLVPRHHMGAASGLLAASGSLAAPLASLVAGGLSQDYGPRAIFAVMAAMTCLGLILLPYSRNPAGRESVPEDAAAEPAPTLSQPQALD